MRKIKTYEVTAIPESSNPHNKQDTRIILKSLISTLQYPILVSANVFKIKMQEHDQMETYTEMLALFFLKFLSQQNSIHSRIKAVFVDLGLV
jgi:hypothetical protein